MFEEPVDVHEYLTKVEIPQAPAMPIYPGGCSRSYDNLQRLQQHYANILVRVRAEPDDLTRIRKILYLMLEYKNEESYGLSFRELLAQIMAIPVTEGILVYLTRFAASGLNGNIPAFLTLKEFLSGNIPLDCPSCGGSLQNSFSMAGGVCRGCHATIPAHHFMQSQWYKCTCGKMTHVSDSGFVCTCGMQFSSNELEAFRIVTEEKVLAGRIQQTLRQAGLAPTALNGIMAPWDRGLQYLE